MGTRDELADLLAFLDREELRPRIGQELALDSAADGVEAMIEGRTSGKIVFTL
jgi:NADPH:quinone reductase-like Zn-dependent oxidoreductase